jgi:hypothetical protein
MQSSRTHCLARCSQAIPADGGIRLARRRLHRVVIRATVRYQQQDMGNAMIC